jgi:S-adenosyl-L-methionine-dependent methyltransferase
LKALPSTPAATSYQLVQLPGGTHSLHSLAYGETLHPVVGPVAEAESLYVNQLRLRERLKNYAGEFVIWDVGLGAAANALTVLRAIREIPRAIRLVSFDDTTEPLEFGLQNAAALGYFGGYEKQLETLLRTHQVTFRNGEQSVNWQLHSGDFPTLLAGALEERHSQTVASKWGVAPHIILFDAFSPAKNPDMWTLPLFTNLFRMLDPQRSCVLPTYSRSTLLRVTLLLAGFFVGVGQATGVKAETTIAANTPERVAEPLGRKWLQRARVSGSAEPLHDAVYRQLPLAGATWERLRAHPQFQ